MSEPEGVRPAEGEGGPSRAIPGAWARPASAFVDESSVVRPERLGGGGARGASLVVLGALAVAAAVFAWGVTMALQDLEAPLEAIYPEGSVEAPPPSAAALTVPEADPSFPALPGADSGDEPLAAATEDSAEELDVDLPTPKLLRLARGEDDDEPPRRRVKRPTGKGQQQAARQSTSPTRRRGRQARQASAPVVEPTRAEIPSAPPAAPPAPPPAAPTAASLTREAEQRLAQGSLDEARALAERALGLSRGYPRAHRARAVICARQGDTDCARQGYETYLRLAPDAPDAPDVRRILGM